MMSYAKFVETIDQLEESRTLMAALEFRIYTVLEKKSMTARQITAKCKTQLEGTEALLNALVAMGAMKLSGGKYSSPPELYKKLCETSPHYQKGKVMLTKENRDEWANLINTIRYGRDLSAFEGGDDPAFRRLFTYAMHERSEALADKIAGIVARKRVGRLLDLGGGPGSYAVAILRKDKKATATLLDRPATLGAAREIHGGGSLAKRIQFVPGDLFDTLYGKDYDTVFFSNILHIYNEKQNKTLLGKISRSLVKGGRVILVDYFLDEKRVAPYDAAMFSLTMLLFTETGRTYTEKETEKLLRGAGFGQIKKFKLPKGGGIIQAIKK